MNWTKEQPTKGGFYWAFDGKEVVPVDLYWDGSILVAFELGDPYDIPLDLNNFTHFMGPMEPPEPPKDIER